jgi:DNA uptake protein ComE-like DNA-binding protein
MVFQHITDLKFVTGMTAEIFTANRSGMTVVTNINTASIEELRTLGMSEAQAENVANSRATLGSFDDIQQLRSRNLITQGLFDSIQHFIAVESKERVEFARPNFRANINLASQAQLTRAGATPIQATTIISQRDHMPLRNMQDLLSGTNVSTNFSVANTLSLADNFRTRTNLNTAPRSELESLFGSALTSTDLSAAVNAIINARENAPLASLAQFTQILSAPNLTSPVPTALVNNILNFVYINEPPQQTIVNLNTATQQQLTDAGIPLGIAQQIGRLTNRGSILVPSQIPSFITAEHRQVLTLRTNINTATLDELLSLDAGMTHTIAQRVITARANQPFGSLAEVDEFFSSLQLRPMYLRFSPIIIVR